MTHFSFSFWTWIWFLSVRLQSRQSERVGIITMKFLRTRIHFLSDVSWGNLSFLGLSFPDLVASEIFGSEVWGLRSEFSRHPYLSIPLHYGILFFPSVNEREKNAVAKNQLPSRFTFTFTLLIRKGGNHRADIK